MKPHPMGPNAAARALDVFTRGYGPATPATRLDALCDDLARVEVGLDLEAEFGWPRIPDPILFGWQTVGDVQAYCEQRTQAERTDAAGEG